MSRSIFPRIFRPPFSSDLFSATFSVAALPATCATSFTGSGSGLFSTEGAASLLRVLVLITISFSTISSSSCSFFFFAPRSTMSLSLMTTFSASFLSFRSSPNLASIAGRYSSDILAFGSVPSPAPFSLRNSTSVCTPMLNCFANLLILISAIY